MVRKHPDVKEKGSKIDLSDLRNDPVVMFQHRHYLPLAMTLCIVLPTLIPGRNHSSVKSFGFELGFHQRLVHKTTITVIVVMHSTPTLLGIPSFPRF